MDRPEENNFREALIQNMAELNEDEVLAIVKERMAQGENPFHLVEACRAGVQLVGERYERRDYFLSGLIMAGEIFQEVMQILGPAITDQYKGNELGSILLGTVAGDIHNIGKNILSMLLTSYGFTVRDLGVDVPPEEFVQNALEMHPGAVGLSGLLTSSFESMKETIAMIRQAGGPLAQIPIVVGGGTTDAQVCEFVGADNWANDAMVGVRIFKKLLEEKK